MSRLLCLLHLHNWTPRPDAYRIEVCARPTCKAIRYREPTKHSVSTGIRS